MREIAASLSLEGLETMQERYLAANEEPINWSAGSRFRRTAGLGGSSERWSSGVF